MNQSYVPSQQQRQQLVQHQALKYSIPEEELDSSGETSLASWPPVNVLAGQESREPRKRKYRERRSLDSMYMSRRVASPNPVPGITSGIPREGPTINSSFSNSGTIKTSRPTARRSFDVGSITAGLPVRPIPSLNFDSLDIYELLGNLSPASNPAANFYSLNNSSKRTAPAGLLSSDSNASSNNSLSSVGSSTSNSTGLKSRLLPGITSGLPVCSPSETIIPDIVSCDSLVADITSGMSMSTVRGSSSPGIMSGIPPPNFSTANVNKNYSNNNIVPTTSSQSSQFFMNFPISDTDIPNLLPNQPGITSGIPLRKVSHELALQTPFVDSSYLSSTTEKEYLEPWQPLVLQDSTTPKLSLAFSLSAMDLSEVDNASQGSERPNGEDSMEDVSISMEARSSKLPSGRKHVGQRKLGIPLLNVQQATFTGCSVETKSPDLLSVSCLSAAHLLGHSSQLNPTSLFDTSVSFNQSDVFHQLNDNTSPTVPFFSSYSDNNSSNNNSTLNIHPSNSYNTLSSHNTRSTTALSFNSSYQPKTQFQHLSGVQQQVPHLGKGLQSGSHSYSPYRPGKQMRQRKTGLTTVMESNNCFSATGAGGSISGGFSAFAAVNFANSSLTNSENGNPNITQSQQHTLPATFPGQLFTFSQSGLSASPDRLALNNINPLSVSAMNEASADHISDIAAASHSNNNCGFSSVGNQPISGYNPYEVTPSGLDQLPLNSRCVGKTFGTTTYVLRESTDEDMDATESEDTASQLVGHSFADR